MKYNVEVIGTQDAPLVLEITTVNNDTLVYEIRVKQQKYISRYFFGNTCKFNASNNFRLVSDSSPEVVCVNTAYNSLGGVNKLFVRGMCTSMDDRVASVRSIAYIEQLKIAVKEYNEARK